MRERSANLPRTDQSDLLARHKPCFPDLDKICAPIIPPAQGAQASRWAITEPCSFAASTRLRAATGHERRPPRCQIRAELKWCSGAMDLAKLSSSSICRSEDNAPCWPQRRGADTLGRRQGGAAKHAAQFGQTCHYLFHWPSCSTGHLLPLAIFGTIDLVMSVEAGAILTAEAVVAVLIGALALMGPLPPSPIVVPRRRSACPNMRSCGSCGRS